MLKKALALDPVSPLVQGDLGETEKALQCLQQAARAARTPLCGKVRAGTFGTDSFESKMEYTQDGRKTWLPGNHQVFRGA